MPMFAISWALVVCNAISSLTAIPAVLYGVDDEKFTAASASAGLERTSLRF